MIRLVNSFVFEMVYLTMAYGAGETLIHAGITIRPAHVICFMFINWIVVFSLLHGVGDKVETTNGF